MLQQLNIPIFYLFVLEGRVIPWKTEAQTLSERGYWDEQVIKLLKTTESATFRPSETVATSTALR